MIWDENKDDKPGVNCSAVAGPVAGRIHEYMDNGAGEYVLEKSSIRILYGVLNPDGDRNIVYSRSEELIDDQWVQKAFFLNYRIGDLK